MQNYHFLYIRKCFYKHASGKKILDEQISSGVKTHLLINGFVYVLI